MVCEKKQRNKSVNVKNQVSTAGSGAMSRATPEAKSTTKSNSIITSNNANTSNNVITHPMGA
jgi:hypothetical protein